MKKSEMKDRIEELQADVEYEHWCLERIIRHLVTLESMYELESRAAGQEESALPADSILGKLKHEDFLTKRASRAAISNVLRYVKNIKAEVESRVSFDFLNEEE